MTRALLKSSLLGILATKPLSQITIKEICESADLNRSTFYAYYSSPYDLLTSIEQDLVQDARKLLNACPDLPPEEKMRYLLERHLEYTAAHIEEFRAFSPDRGEDFLIPAQIMEIILSPYIRYLSDGKRITSIGKRDLQTFCVFGTIGIVKHWVIRNMDTPVKQLSRTILQLLNNAFAAYR